MISRRFTACLALALLVLAAAGSSQVAAAPIKLGVYHCPEVASGTPCYSTDAAALDSYKSAYGRYPEVALNYRMLTEPLLYSSERTALKERGITPMMTVEPYAEKYGQCAGLQKIVEGKYDSNIETAATQAVEFGNEVLLRFAHEMNGPWYSCWHGNPTLYKEAFQHYVNVFRAKKATNVKFVWSPNVNNASNSYPFAEYFPGDEYVDFVALDGYNRGGSEWMSVEQIFAASYATITALSTKPVIIAETSSHEAGGSKAEWIRTGFLSTIPEKFPKVVAVVWFNRDFTASGQRDWRIGTSAASTAAWKDISNSALYGGNVHYLRPNAVRSTTKPWTVTGAASAWAALDDPVTPAATPTATDYISASGFAAFTTEVDLATTSLIGKDVAAAKVWFHTATATKVKVEARGPGGALASTEPASTGWHSLSVPLDETQSQLDGLYLRFTSVASGTSQQISAALLELTTEPGNPLDLGAYYCPSTPCLTTGGTALDSYKNQYGRYPDIAMNYRGLDAPLLYSSEITDLKARGVTPMMTVEPYVGGKAVSLTAIANGTYDSWIHEQAAAAKSFGQPLLLRFAQQMNGNWYAWSGEPTAYKAAWTHYVDVFREDKATNVKFVWSPWVNAGGAYPFNAYFPGDEYVDYLALAGYNRGGAEWQSLAQVFGSSYTEIAKLSNDPILIAETASAESGGSKPEWIRKGLLETVLAEFPRVVGVIWFSRDYSGSGQADWRLESSTASREAWQDIVDSVFYGG
jgi:beta-mannanase